MWFLWLALALALLIVSGVYTRRRVVQAAAALGLGPRGQRVLRWAIVWLLFGYPVLVIAAIDTLMIGNLRCTPKRSFVSM